MTYTFSEVQLSNSLKMSFNFGRETKVSARLGEKQNLIGLGGDIWKVFKLCKWLHKPIPFAQGWYARA